MRAEGKGERGEEGGGSTADKLVNAKFYIESN